MIHTINKEKFYFEINKNEDDFFYFQLKDEKSKILLKSLIYTHKTDCQKWIKSVLRNFKNRERFIIEQPYNYTWIVYLKAENGEKIANSPCFATEEEAINMIKDLKSLTLETPVVDKTK